MYIVVNVYFRLREKNIVVFNKSEYKHIIKQVEKEHMKKQIKRKPAEIVKFNYGRL